MFVGHRSGSKLLEADGTLEFKLFLGILLRAVVVDRVFDYSGGCVAQHATIRLTVGTLLDCSGNREVLRLLFFLLLEIIGVGL